MDFSTSKVVKEEVKKMDFSAIFLNDKLRLLFYRRWKDALEPNIFRFLGLKKFHIFHILLKLLVNLHEMYNPTFLASFCINFPND